MIITIEHKDQKHSYVVDDNTPPEEIDMIALFKNLERSREYDKKYGAANKAAQKAFSTFVKTQEEDIPSKIWQEAVGAE